LLAFRHPCLLRGDLLFAALAPLSLAPVSATRFTNASLHRSQFQN